MSTVDNDAHQPESTPADELDALNNDEPAEEDAATEPENAPPSPPSPRPLRIYTRTQILALLKSPLVSPPPNMPELKDWFGAENEQNLNKKDHEATPPNSARERRFRRDVDDAVTQKHQHDPHIAQPSLNPRKWVISNTNPYVTEMEKRIETFGTRKDKNGYEMQVIRFNYVIYALQTLQLSDKFDRDRLALPLSNLRNKDRGDPSTTRPAGPNQLPNTRRTEARENGKKKTESTDDWRRGGEPRRGDREDRDRARSRSRGAGILPLNATIGTAATGSEMTIVAIGMQRETIHGVGEMTGDAMSAWRSEGITKSDGPQKVGEEGKEAADRRADREKEKEPAWMDTYVPSPTSSGILGGKGADGELDGIQAWKKGMKEKERAAAEATEVAPKATSEKPLDEIQLFKMMMKREQQKGQDGEEDISLGPKMAAVHAAKDMASVPTVNTEASAPAAMPVFSLNEQNKPTDEQHVLSSALSPMSIGEPESASSAGVFNPPPGPRLLALGRVTAKPRPTAPVATQASSSTTAIKRPPPQLNLTSGIQSLDNSDKSTFSPFEEQRASPSLGGVQESQRRERPPIPSDASWNDPLDPGMVKGSRFAKFFDGKVKEAAPTPKLPPPSALSPPIPAPRPEHIGYQHQQPPESRTVDDLFAMITAQTHQRAPPSNPPSTAPGSNTNHMTHQQMQSQLHLLQQQQRHHHQQQQLHHLQQRHQQVDPLYENRLDNRNFMPDNMVPGLRSAPPPRNGDNGGMFSDPLDEVIHINAQRPPLPLHRGLDPLYSGGGMPPYASQQSGRGAGIPVQYRGGPSPIGNQNGLGRLPPGLANLGGRPPHEPSQFSGLPGLNSAALHGGPINPPQSYNNYSSMGPGFNNGPPRGMPPQISGNLAQHQLAGLGHQNLMDLRNHNMNPPNMLNIGGGPLNAGRGMGGGYPGHGGSHLFTICDNRLSNLRFPLMSA
ncbi:hypothetical protein BDZ89DRAFT_1127897 [Hymenopellis radicata]|nr:hypothetical protein BDZ89DRAFT_1127897 [Hymenopellis radicata]